MLLETLKILLPLLGGGAAGVLLNEWLRRRSAKVQTIPLIERVNRLVKPGLRGFTLARTLGDGKLEEIRNVREYQFTLRNTSSVHLQNAEIQFEFPADDVEGRAERPSLSNTAPLQVDAVVNPPWKRAFRWQIPQFPSSDSIEFTFRAVDPTSDGFDVALYNSGQVVIEKSQRESTSSKASWGMPTRVAILAITGAAFGALLSGLFAFLGGGSEKHLFSLNDQGCFLTVISSYEQVNSMAWPWQGPWKVNYQVLNTGPQKCTVQSALTDDANTTVAPSGDLTRVVYSDKRPRIVWSDFWFGPGSPVTKVRISVYGKPD